MHEQAQDRGHQGPRSTRLAQAILAELGGPVISTSAKRENDDWTSNDPEEIAAKFKNLDMVLDSGLGGISPSTVIRITDDGEIEVLREGSGPVDDLF